MNNKIWQIRAAAWELAALSFRYPGEELAGAAASGEREEAAKEVLVEHARAWMPAFVGRLAAESRHPFCRVAATYLVALVG